jgi:hypothetical protein
MCSQSAVSDTPSGNEFLRSVDFWARSYESLFHPMYSLIRDINKAYASWGELLGVIENNQLPKV